METRPSDAGDTLVEILVSLAVLGIAVVALVGALMTNITTTVINRDQAQAHALLASAAEQVKALKDVPFSCGSGAGTLSPAELARPSGFTITYGPTVQVESQPCTALVAVPVRVQGKGFDLAVRVVKRA